MSNIVEAANVRHDKFKTKSIIDLQADGAQGVQQDHYYYHKVNITYSVMKASLRSIANLSLELTLPLKFDSTLCRGFSFVFTEKHK